MLGAQKSYLQIINILLAAGADVNYENQFGDTPLVWAIKKGNIDVVNVLLTKDADVNHVDQYGNTSLIWAIKKRLYWNI